VEFPLEPLVSIALGVGLAAAAGFRMFLPLLAVGLAARAEWIPLTESFAWLAATPALLTLGTAALLEALAYFIPGLDHLLDVLSAPAAIAAGTIVSASVMADVPTAVMWPVAIIAGGGVAGAAKGGAALLRAQTGMATAGFGNPVVSTAETFGAAALSLLALLVPIACFIAVIALLIWGGRRASRTLFGRRQTPAAQRELPEP
jgi:Domain of unknown function (DUF4126)